LDKLEEQKEDIMDKLNEIAEAYSQINEVPFGNYLIMVIKLIIL